MARPRIEIDIFKVEEYAAQGLTQAEICLCLGISEGTLYSRKRESEVFEEAIKRGKAKAASEISNVLYQMARKGDLGAVIWYEKTRRGLSDRQAVEHSGPAGAPIAIEFNYHAVATEITSGSGEDSETPG